jgi:multisubunit Na+/H+ antiporter MnhC subunit
MFITIEGVLYFAAIALSLIGLFGLMASNNVFRMLLALIMFESGANLILVLSGYHVGGVAPIFQTATANGVMMNDPVPQALVLTAIVIGVGIQALALALIFKVKKHYNTLDMRIIRAKLEADIASDTGVRAAGSDEKPAGVRDE